MHKDGDVEDGVWDQVVCLNSPVKKKTAEEITRRNSKSTFNKWDESDNFTHLLDGSTVA